MFRIMLAFSATLLMAISLTMADDVLDKQIVTNLIHGQRSFSLGLLRTDLIMIVYPQNYTNFNGDLLSKERNLSDIFVFKQPTARSLNLTTKKLHLYGVRPLATVWPNFFSQLNASKRLQKYSSLLLSDHTASYLFYSEINPTERPAYYRLDLWYNLDEDARVVMKTKDLNEMPGNFGRTRLPIESAGSNNQTSYYGFFALPKFSKYTFVVGNQAKSIQLPEADNIRRDFYVSICADNVTNATLVLLPYFDGCIPPSIGQVGGGFLDAEERLFLFSYEPAPMLYLSNGSIVLNENRTLVTFEAVPLEQFFVAGRPDGGGGSDGRTLWILLAAIIGFGVLGIFACLVVYLWNRKKKKRMKVSTKKNIKISEEKNLRQPAPESKVTATSKTEMTSTTAAATSGSISKPTLSSQAPIRPSISLCRVKSSQTKTGSTLPTSKKMAAPKLQSKKP